MKISVLSAVFNEAAYVAEMIESVQAQPHQDWELVIVDDASTDDTVAIVERYAAADPRVRLASQGTKLGVVGAFNAAYAASTGDVVSLLAGDDRLTPDSFAIRLQHHPVTDRPAASFYKLRTFSTNPRYHGAVLPKGAAGSRSGAGVTMNRPLADKIFPIPTRLRAEDIYLAAIIDDLAEVRREVPRVIMEYRIHEQNSNPRRAPFKEMNERMHALNAAYGVVAEAADELGLTPATRHRVAEFQRAEEYRYRGRWLDVLRHPKLPLVDRLAYAAMANPVLYAVRQTFFRWFSGHRGG